MNDPLTALGVATITDPGTRFDVACSLWPKLRNRALALQHTSYIPKNTPLSSLPYLCAYVGCDTITHHTTADTRKGARVFADGCWPTATLAASGRIPLDTPTRDVLHYTHSDTTTWNATTIAATITFIAATAPQSLPLVEMALTGLLGDTPVDNTEVFDACITLPLPQFTPTRFTLHLASHSNATPSSIYQFFRNHPPHRHDIEQWGNDVLLGDTHPRHLPAALAVNHREVAQAVIDDLNWLGLLDDIPDPAWFADMRTIAPQRYRQALTRTQPAPLQPKPAKTPDLFVDHLARWELASFAKRRVVADELCATVPSLASWLISRPAGTFTPSLAAALWERAADRCNIHVFTRFARGNHTTFDATVKLAAVAAN